MRALYPALLLAAVLVLFAPFWLRGEVFVPGDFLDRIYPWKASGRVDRQNPEPFDVAVFFYPQDVLYNRELKAGRLPLWNPQIFAGHPWIASGQSGQLYPLRLALHWSFPPAVARTLSLMLHLAASGLCMYFFLRSRRFGPSAAALGSAVFMLNAFTATWLEFEHVPILGGLTALMLWAVERSNPFGLALAGGLALHAGHLQFCLYLGPLVALYAIVRRVSLARLALGAALAVALSAPVTFPFLQLQSLSQRPALELSRQAAPLASYLPTLLSPDFWGNPARGLMVNRVQANLIFSEFACYLGFLPLLLALVGVFSPGGVMTRRERAFWGLVALGALWAASATFPYSQLAEVAPFLGRLVPGRVLILFVLAGAMLSAQGCQRLEEDYQRISRRLASGALAAGALWLGLAAWFLTTVRPADLKLPAADTPGLVDGFADLLRQAWLHDPQNWVPLAGVLVCLALTRLKPSKAVPLVVLFTLADLLLLPVSYNPTCREPFPPTPALELVARQPGIHRTDKFRAAFYNTLTPYGCQLVTGYESLFPARYYRVVALAQPGAPPPVRSLSLQRFEHPILDALNLKYLIAIPDAPMPGPAWRELWREDAAVFENTAALPRARVIGRVVPTNDLEDSLAFLAGPDFDPRQVACVEGSMGPVGEGPSQVAITDYQCNKVTLEAELQTPGLLVLADQFYPGWEARVNGSPRPIVCVNGALRGIFLPAGRHQVDFRFRPRPYFIGLWLAGGALLLMGLWALGETFLTRRSGREDSTERPAPGQVDQALDNASALDRPR